MCEIINSNQTKENFCRDPNLITEDDVCKTEVRQEEGQN